MRSQVFNLAVPLTTGQGASLPTRDFSGKWVQISGSFTGGTVVLQGSINDSDFLDLASGAKTAPAIFEVPEHINSIRVSTTVDISGGDIAMNLIAFVRTEE